MSLPLLVSIVVVALGDAKTNNFLWQIVDSPGAAGTRAKKVSGCEVALKLFASERHHRIHTRGPARRQIPGHDCDSEQQQRSGNK